MTHASFTNSLKKLTSASSQNQREPYNPSTIDMHEDQLKGCTSLTNSFKKMRASIKLKLLHKHSLLAARPIKEPRNTIKVKKHPPPK